MRVNVAVHQMDTSYLSALIGPSDDDPNPGAHDPQDAIGGVYGKVFDGLDFMVRYDSAPGSIDGYLRVREIAEAHKGKGRLWLPWAVPHGDYPESEGRRYGFAARVAAEVSGEAPVFILNVEPYPQFWRHRGAETKARASAFCDAYRETAGEDSEIWIWADCREWQMSADRGIGFEHWWDQDVVTRALPEMYWTSIGKSPDDTIDEQLRVLQGYDVPASMIEPTFPADSRTDQLLNAFRLAHNRGFKKPNLWQRSNLTVSNGLALAQAYDPWAVTETVEPPAPPQPAPVGVRLEEAYARGHTAGWADARDRLAGTPVSPTIPEDL